MHPCRRTIQPKIKHTVIHSRFGLYKLEEASKHQALYQHMTFFKGSFKGSFTGFFKGSLKGFFKGSFKGDPTIEPQSGTLL